MEGTQGRHARGQPDGLKGLVLGQDLAPCIALPLPEPGQSPKEILFVFCALSCWADGGAAAVRFARFVPLELSSRARAFEL